MDLESSLIVTLVLTGGIIDIQTLELLECYTNKGGKFDLLIFHLKLMGLENHFLNVQFLRDHILQPTNA